MQACPNPAGWTLEAHEDSSEERHMHSMDRAMESAPISQVLQAPDLWPDAQGPARMAPGGMIRSDNFEQLDGFRRHTIIIQ